MTHDPQQRSHPSTPRPTHAWLAALVAIPMAIPALTPPIDLQAEGAPAPVEPAFAPIDRAANQHQPSSQEAATLARTPSGRTVVAWHSRKQQAGGTYGVYARLYGADGEPLTGELQVNANTHSSQTRPAVDVAPDGSVWITWESYGQDGDQGSIVARRFKPDLSSATEELLVNGGLAVDLSAEQLVASGALGHQQQPVICTLADGSAWVAWTTSTAPKSGNQLDSGDQTDGRIALRHIAANGRDLGTTILLEHPDQARDGYPCLARSEDTLLCVFARTDQNGMPTGIHAQQLTTAGELTGELRALHIKGTQPIEPALCAASGPGSTSAFGVAWMSGQDGNYTPYWRTLTNATLGAPQRVETEHEGDGGGYTSGLEIAIDAGGPDMPGRALVVWGRAGGEEQQADLWAVLYDLDGAALTAPFRATQTASKEQRFSLGSGARRAWIAADGRYGLAWTGFAGGSDSSAASISLAGLSGAEGDRAQQPEPRDSNPEPLVAAATSSTAPAWAAIEKGAAPHRPPIQSIAPTLAGPAALPVTAAGGFQGFPQASLTPPDPELAIGPDHAVAVINDGIRFFTLDGTLTFSDTISQPGGFFAPSGIANSAFIFDPEALYDPHSGRFMVMANARTSGGLFLLSVSDDSDPNGNWNHYAFNVTAAAGAADIDSPNFSVNDSSVFLTADFFTPQDKFLVFVVDKAPLLTGGTPSTGFQLITGSQSFGVPLVYDAGAPGYMLQSFENLPSSSMRIWAIQGGSNPTLTSTLVTVPSYTGATDPSQAGTTVRPELFEPRFWSCTMRNGSLWATHHQGNPVRQRWYEFALNGWPSSGNLPSLAQAGDINPGGGVQTFFGSIAVGPTNSVAFTVSRSSPSEFISMYVTTRKASDPPGFTEPLTLAQASTSPDFSGRWGDYSGAAPDPDRSGGFWLHGEFRTDSWRTWIEPIDAGSAPGIYCTPKLSSALCASLIGTSDLTGQPISGANDYSVTCSEVQGQKNGLLFGGISGPAAIPFSNGTLCVAPPNERGPVLFSGGISPNDCSGSFSLIVNDGALIPFGLDAGSGNTAWYQWWYRDPGNGAGNLGTALSNAVQLDYL